MPCPHIDSCPMFRIFQTKSLLKIWTMRFCESNLYPTCERYRLAERGQLVPRNLLPNGHSLPDVGRSEDISTLDRLHPSRAK
jgi:hypothetical protein